jgi:aldehyde dehydrogenase (NAD+)
MRRTLLSNLSTRALRQKIRFGQLSLRVRLLSTAAPQTLDINGKKISIPTGLFINNEFVPAIGGNTFGVENPTNGQQFIQIQEGREEDVDVAVKVARKTFESDEWANSNPAWRGELLNKLADLMQRDFEDLVAVEMLDTGKTYAQASSLDVPGSIGTLRYYSGWADKILGLTSFNIPGTFAYTRREPVGVCGQIIPWK